MTLELDNPADRPTEVPCRGGIKALAVILALGLLQPLHAYKWKGHRGYFVPLVLISPLEDNIAYTPVGHGLVTSKAGFRRHPITGRHSFHSGVDLDARLNDKVYNLLDGIVTHVGWRGNLGLAVEIYHPYPNILTICGHLNAYSVRPGEWVQRGRVIGYAGSTGRSTGVHVHYTVKRYDTREYIDPIAFLRMLPQYTVALQSARARALARRNVDAFKKAPLRADEEELDKPAGDAQPPDPDLSDI